MADWVNTDGSFGNMEEAPEGVSNIVSNNGFKGVEDLSTAYSELYKMQGSQAEKLNIPEGFSDDMRGQMLTALGRPDKADDYDFGDLNDTIEPEMMKGIRTLLHEQGLSQSQATSIVKSINDMGNSAVDDIKATAIKLEAELKEEMGDKFEPYRDAALDTADKLGILKTLHDTGLIAKREVLDAMTAIANQISEDSLNTITQPVVNETSQEKKDKLMANPAMMDKMHPDHERVHEEWLALMTG